jgi:cystathionine beta-lyase
VNDAGDRRVSERTRVVHAGPDRDPVTGASSLPIYQASTFAQDDPVRFGRYDYSRSGNPTREALERAMAELEGGSVGLAFASGMAAISSTLMLLQPGDHVVVSEDIYGGTFRVLTTLFKRWGLAVTFADTTDPDSVRSAILPSTRALIVETPSNPLLRITDLRAMVHLAREHDLLSVVDNTFMTPYLQRPLDLGFDLVLHSATKFLGGHSDLIAGVAVAREEDVGLRLRRIQNSFGAVLAPHDAWLLLRGLRTLAARLDAQQRGAEHIATYLAGHEAVGSVRYPSLETHTGRATHLAQARGAGAVISFELRDPGLTLGFLRSVRLPLLAVSLGGVESIMSYPRTMSHAGMPAEERHRRGISDGLVRLSVGLEDPEDLVADIEQALRAARSEIEARTPGAVAPAHDDVVKQGE